MNTGFIPTLAGAGTTSLVIELAFELAARGRAITLVDADPVAELSVRTRTRPRTPLSDVFGWSECDAAVHGSATPLDARVAIVPVDDGRFVGAGLALTPGVLAACAAAQAPCGALFIDLPPAGAPATSAALTVLDGVVGVIPATAAGVRSIAAFLRLVLGTRTRAGQPPTLRALVLAQTRDGEASDAIARELSRCTSAVVPTVSVPWDRDLERDSLRRELNGSRSAALKRAIAQLADAIEDSVTTAPAPEAVMNRDEVPAGRLVRSASSEAAVGRPRTTGGGAIARP